MSAWSAVCKPRWEALGERNLITQSYEVFLPRMASRERQEPTTGAIAIRSRFQPGAQVQFDPGPLAWPEGIFNVDTLEDQGMVPLEFLGKINKVKVNRDGLVRAA